MGLWASVLTIPAFGLTVAFGPAMIRAFGLAPDVEALAIEFWIPRMIGGPLAAALWAAVAFFNGIGRTRIPLAIGLVVLGSNAVLNEIFIFRFGWGMAGAAWATTSRRADRRRARDPHDPARSTPRRFAPHLTWRPKLAAHRRADRARPADGDDRLRRPRRRGAVPAHAGAGRRRRRRRDPDRHDLHRDRLHAGHRPCARGHDARRPGDRRRRPRLGRAARQPHHRRRRLLHGRHRPRDRAGRQLAGAAVRECRGPARGRGHRALLVAALARRRLPVLRRRQFRERVLPARRGRCARPGAHRARLRHAALPAADAPADFRAGPGLVRRRAGLRPRRGRRLERDPRLRGRDRDRALVPLEERRLEEDPA